jgi:hypothetical protein
MKRIFCYPKKLLSKFFGLYIEGLGGTIIIVVVAFFLAFLINAADTITKFIPEKYIFPNMGVTIVFIILPVLVMFSKKTRISRVLAMGMRRIPFVKFFFRKKGVQEGIPVAVEDNGVIEYGFLRGRTIIHDHTGLLPESGKEWWSVFIPSSPVPATSLMPKDFDPRKVREVEICAQPGRNFALAAILSKCIYLGESLGEIKLLTIESAEVAKMPAITDKDKEEIKKSYKKALA